MLYLSAINTQYKVTLLLFSYLDEAKKKFLSGEFGVEMIRFYYLPEARPNLKKGVEKIPEASKPSSCVTKCQDLERSGKKIFFASL
jgi:hypothetical protein